ncbi:MAG: hypothetical protein V1767_02070 [Chloroflexota bacterium]
MYHYRMFAVLMAVVFTAVLFVGCTDKEKEQLKQDKLDLQAQITNNDFIISSLKSHAENDLSILKRCQSDYVATIDSLSDARKQVELLRSEYKQLQSQLASQLAEVARLTPFENMYAECSKELAYTKNELTDSKFMNISLVGELDAKGSLLDSVRMCYDVQRHNANRPWLSKVFSSGEWDLSFAEPAFIATPVITANPAVKPTPAEKPKKGRRR